MHKNRLTVAPNAQKVAHPMWMMYFYLGKQLAAQNFCWCANGLGFFNGNGISGGERWWRYYVYVKQYMQSSQKLMFNSLIVPLIRLNLSQCCDMINFRSPRNKRNGTMKGKSARKTNKKEKERWMTETLVFYWIHHTIISECVSCMRKIHLSRHFVFFCTLATALFPCWGFASVLI